MTVVRWKEKRKTANITLFSEKLTNSQKQKEMLGSTDISRITSQHILKFFSSVSFLETSILIIASKLRHYCKPIFLVLRATFHLVLCNNCFHECPEI